VESSWAKKPYETIWPEKGIWDFAWLGYKGEKQRTEIEGESGRTHDENTNSLMATKQPKGVT